MHKAAIDRSDERTAEEAGGKKRAWRVCSVSDVESAKLLIRMIPVYGTYLLCGAVCAIGDAYVLEQATHMSFTIGPWRPPPQLLLLLFNYFKNRGMNTLYTEHLPSRYDVAASGPTTSSIVFCALAAAVETRRVHLVRRDGLLDDDTAPMGVFWLIFVVIYLGQTEGRVNRGLSAFNEDEAPVSMKRYYSCLEEGVVGLGYICGGLSVYVVGKVSEIGGRNGWFQYSLNKSRLDRYYWVLMALCVLNLCFCSAVSSSYKSKNIQAGQEETAREEKRLRNKLKSKLLGLLDKVDLDTIKILSKGFEIAEEEVKREELTLDGICNEIPKIIKEMLDTTANEEAEKVELDQTSDIAVKEEAENGKAGEMLDQKPDTIAKKEAKSGEAEVEVLDQASDPITKKEAEQEELGQKPSITLNGEAKVEVSDKMSDPIAKEEAELEVSDQTHDAITKDEDEQRGAEVKALDQTSYPIAKKEAEQEELGQKPNRIGNGEVEVEVSDKMSDPIANDEVGEEVLDQTPDTIAKKEELGVLDQTSDRIAKEEAEEEEAELEVIDQTSDRIAKEEAEEEEAEVEVIEQTSDQIAKEEAEEEEAKLEVIDQTSDTIANEEAKQKVEDQTLNK